MRKAVDDWNTYLANGGIAKALFIQCSPELANLVEEIRKDYQQAYFFKLNFRDSNAEEATKAFHVFERNKARIIKVQELINKELEEL